jgi:hypothetical protein
MTDVASLLRQISNAPSDSEGASFDTWLELSDALAFLKANARQDEFVVYANLQHAFIHAVLVPSPLVDMPDNEDLLAWHYDAYSSWGVEIRYTTPVSISITEPLDHTGSKTLDHGEQLVFARSFEGLLDEKHYFEILQKFLHISDLHFVPERKAYCRLDENGDIEDVVRVVTAPRKGEDCGGTIVTFSREVLDRYQALTGASVVRMFDFTRFRPHFSGWRGDHASEYSTDGDLIHRIHIEAGNASYVRGVQIIRSQTPKEAVAGRFGPASSEGEQYESFLAFDWKNGTLKEISCSPEATVNYFTASVLPYELSPAFFRPEVLAKYKADRDKYDLEDRSLSCRSTWHLQNFDINEAGQVHTYLVYLRNLPYKEQLHWKVYNEAPKGGISERAYRTDFEGCWDTKYDPLASLKGVFREWNEAQVPWWTLHSDRLLKQLYYPVTASADEWADEILQLDQLVIEGFEVKWLRAKVQELRRAVDQTAASLTLVQQCLIGLGLGESDAMKVVEPLKVVHHLRNKVKGHSSGRETIKIKQKVLTEHRSYTEHFRVLCSQCDDSVRAIGKALEGRGGDTATR